MDVGGCCFYSHQFVINSRCSEVIQLLACKLRYGNTTNNNVVAPPCFCDLDKRSVQYRCSFITGSTNV